MPTTYGNDIVYCLKSHCGVRGYCRQKWVLQVQIICKFSNERTCKRNKDVQGLSCGFEDKVDIFRIFPRNNTHKGFVLPQNDSLQSPSNSKKDQDVFKKALCLFLKALDLFKKRPYL